MSTVTLTCAQCGEEFEKDKNEYTRRLRKLPNVSNFFCSLNCSASHRNRNREHNPGRLEPQYGNKYGQKYPDGVGWYVGRCCWDSRFKQIDESNRSSFAQHLVDKWNEQKERCAFSGVKLKRRDSYGSCNITNPFYIASIDRIDNNHPYQEGNVQWVSVAINYARGNLPVDEFRRHLKEVITDITL